MKEIVLGVIAICSLIIYTLYQMEKLKSDIQEAKVNRMVKSQWERIMIESERQKNSKA